jgi:DHA2 family methylenomycin A resistance protein-like MFS transporter
LVGSAALSLGSWRYLFLVNVPLLACALLSFTLLSYQERQSQGDWRVDLAGAAGMTGLLVALTFLLGYGPSGRPAVVAGASAALVGLGAAFAVGQARAPAPLAEWRLFRLRSFSAGTSYTLLSNLVMYTTLLAVPFFVVEVQGKGSGAVGPLLAAMSLLMALLAPLAGRLADRQGRRLPAVVGGFCQLGAAVMLAAGLSEGASYVFLAGALVLLGVGMGLGQGPAQTASIESAPPAMAGVAAGTASMMRYFGSIVGAGVLGGLLGGDSGAPDPALFQFLSLIVAVTAFLATLAALGIHRFATAERWPDA